MHCSCQVQLRQRPYLKHVYAVLQCSSCIVFNHLEGDFLPTTKARQFKNQHDFNQGKLRILVTKGTPKYQQITIKINVLSMKLISTFMFNNQYVNSSHSCNQHTNLILRNIVPSTPPSSICLLYCMRSTPVLCNLNPHWHPITLNSINVRRVANML